MAITFLNFLEEAIQEKTIKESQSLMEETDGEEGSSGSIDVTKDMALAAKVVAKLKTIPKLKVDPEKSVGSQTSITFRKMKLLQPSNMVVVLKAETTSLKIPGTTKSKNIFTYDIFKIIYNGDVYVPSFLHGKLERGSKIGTVDEYLALVTNVQSVDVQSNLADTNPVNIK